MAGINPRALAVWNQIKEAYPYVTNQGIWGDAAHQARKSDHNTGDAIDLGIPDIQRGTSIADELVKNAAQNGAKYVIFNNQIWNPQQGWHPYGGSNPHTGHVHVSFFREGGDQPDAQVSAAPAPLMQANAPTATLPVPVDPLIPSAPLIPFQIPQIKAPQRPGGRLLGHSSPTVRPQALPDLFFQ